MLALERKKRILEKLQEEKRVVVSELSRLYQVSEETIRRDLDKLEAEGYATKSYGGAVINETAGMDLPVHIRKNRNVQGKQKIAQLAAGMIRDGEKIILDASTTSVFIAKAIKDKEKLTVITNSIEIMVELADVPGWTVISVGGTMKQGELSFWGVKAEDMIRCYYVDKAFISCKAFDRSQGAMDSDEVIAHAKQVMAGAARESILVVDHSKFDRTAFAQITDVGKLSAVLTDVKPSEEWMQYLEEQDVNCWFPAIG